MAGRVPENIEKDETAPTALRRTARFLRDACRPSREFICWTRPPVGARGEGPDFVLYGKRLGLLVLVVKDWTARQIVSYNPHRFTLQISENIIKAPNPDRQARDNATALIDRLKEVAGFVQDRPDGEEGLQVPVGRMVIFPNIKKSDYREKGLQWLIPQERVLLLEDLEPAGDILQESSGRAFLERISGALPFRFKGLPQRVVERLNLLLWPGGAVQIPARHGTGKARFQEEVRALDESQARLALRLRSGHQIIKGPPGSGKTLVLVHRFCHLYRAGPPRKHCLLVCYNIALVGYLKGLVRAKGLESDRGGIHIYHFYELCAKVLGKPVRFENEAPEYYRGVIRSSMETITLGKSSVGPVDAVFIDEAQDFSGEMLRTLLGLLKPEGDLVISLDATQDLYRRGASWHALGIMARGRTHHLNRAYRNTKEIFQFTQRFLGKPYAGKGQLALFPGDSLFHGDPPELCAFAAPEDVERFLIRDITESLDHGGYKRSEIAIIYDDKIYGKGRFSYDNRALPMGLLRSLEQADIATTWVSRDARAKEMYDVVDDRVSLISIHSAKGLDFDLVYLVGMDHMHPTKATMETMISILYVAMTRAKYRLVIPYVEETELIQRMKACLPEKPGLN